MTATPPTLAKDAPGPKGNWLLGSLADARRDPLGLFLSSANTYGDVVRFRFGPATAYLLRGSDAFKQVFVDDHRNFSKDTNAYRNLRLVFGNGLVTSEGDFWLRQRRIAQPAFTRQKIAAIGSIVVEETERMLDAWAARANPDEPFDAFGEVMAAASRLTERALLGTVSESASEVAEALTTVMYVAQERAMSVFPLPPSIPTPRHRKLKAALAVLDRFIYGIIEERRAKGVTDRVDLLSTLMSARDEETGEAMSDKQLRDEVLTLYSAGHETTATGLSWALYLLSQNDAARARLHAELDEVLEGRAPTVEDLPKLGYTRRVIDESLRLRPPIWQVARRVVEPTTIGGYAIPSRAFVFCCIYAAHRNPNVWERPEEFDPDRFLPDRFAAIPRYAYLPFGAGPRMCIGSNLALLEEQLMLATIARRFQLDLVPGHPVEPMPLLVLRPRNGLRMTAKPREKRA